MTRIAPDRTRWRARFFAGIGCEWTAEVTERIPDRRIAWTSRGGTPNSGCVTFHPLGRTRTRVMLQLDYRPERLIEAAGDILRVPQRGLDSALRSFKEYVEGDGGSEPSPAPAEERTAPYRQRQRMPAVFHLVRTTTGPG